MRINEIEIPDTIDGKPTRNSLGKLIHPTIEGIRNFWRWFGDSKVVDSQGRPLVVYHGTRSNIDQFMKSALGINTKAKSSFGGFFFTSSSANAEEYSSGSAAFSGCITNKEIIASWPEEDRAELELAQNYRDALRPKNSRYTGWMLTDEWKKRNKIVCDIFNRLMEKNSAGPNIMHVYLKITNPVEHDMKGLGYRDVSFSELISYAKEKRRGGVIIRNTFDPLFGDVFIVFKPNQIKSAIGNNGNFSVSSNKITERNKNANK